ncbi:hypothetical protein AGLY_002890 [Aphis glycines]|uniref:Uncharacterized protein n=1 Tax=Aphis glycines TaxID=307491 RepID=A0A6G0U2Y0_APHGL|nr:hypothetical protein AGLY_002890 [Aphis glycines]
MLNEATFNEDLLHTASSSSSRWMISCFQVFIPQIVTAVSKFNMTKCYYRLDILESWFKSFTWIVLPSTLELIERFKQEQTNTEMKINYFEHSLLSVLAISTFAYLFSQICRDTHENMLTFENQKLIEVLQLNEAVNLESSILFLSLTELTSFNSVLIVSIESMSTNVQSFLKNKEILWSFAGLSSGIISFTMNREYIKTQRLENLTPSISSNYRTFK